jgi:hypothetical protein
VVARRLGLPLAPVTPARLCPLPSPLYTVLLGYKESPVAEARERFSAMVRTLVHSFLVGQAGRLEAAVGGRFDLVALVPSTRRPGIAPLGLVEGLGHDITTAVPGAYWVADLLQRVDAQGGPPSVAHMRPDPAAFRVAAPGRDAVVGARVLLLDDTYVSGARAQSAAAALARTGARCTLIGPIGRVLRPDRVALHREFLRRRVA